VQDDFRLAAKSIQPTAKREGFAVAPDVTWSDVGALAKVREELLHNVLEPISHPERFRHLGLDVPAGVLFFGPPGCGKTLLAKALANQSGANFISVKGPELLSMYVGESESKVRQVFARARASAPCVIFFDELDALCPKRGSGPEGMSGAGGGNGVSDRVVNQLLTELDGLETRRDVYIIAATNRLELIDDAMLRPGRLGKLLYVPLPTSEDRLSILEALTKKVSITWNTKDPLHGVDLQKVALDHRADGFSGADLAALVREAGLAVVREIVDASKNRAVSHSNSSGGAITSEDIIGRAYVSSGDLTTLVAAAPTGLEEPQTVEMKAAEAKHEESQTIQGRHFEAAFGKVRASVSSKDRDRYELVNHNILEGMGAIQALNEAAKEIASKSRKL
jgi:ribosome biogenesis ATPase